MQVLKDRRKPAILKIRFGSNPTSSATIWFYSLVIRSFVYSLIMSAVSYFGLYIVAIIKKEHYLYLFPGYLKGITIGGFYFLFLNYLQTELVSVPFSVLSFLVLPVIAWTRLKMNLKLSPNVYHFILLNLTPIISYWILAIANTADPWNVLFRGGIDAVRSYLPLYIPLFIVLSLKVWNKNEKDT